MWQFTELQSYGNMYKVLKDPNVYEDKEQYKSLETS